MQLRWKGLQDMHLHMLQASLYQRSLSLNMSPYDPLSSGNTAGIFQLESTGMRDILVKIKPDHFDALVAILALYRPGPLGSGMVDDYIKRRRGLTAVKYETPEF